MYVNNKFDKTSVADKKTWESIRIDLTKTFTL
jgi:hypothetical protein